MCIVLWYKWSTYVVLRCNWPGNSNMISYAAQRRFEGLPEMQRAPMRLIIIQNLYFQRADRLKTVEINCDFCCEDLVFSKVCFVNFLFSTWIKEFSNNFVYTSCFSYVKFPLYLCIFRIRQHDLKVALKYSWVNYTFLKGN